MIYDMFMFYNEFDMLELRLKELSNVVDHFIIVEGTKTFSGLDKLMFYQDNKERFAEWNDKIISMTVDVEVNQNPWTTERQQRNESLRQLRKIIQPDDIIIYSDVDEIPFAEKVDEFKNKPGIKVFHNFLTHYYINFYRGGWQGNRMFTLAERDELIPFKDMYDTRFTLCGQYGKDVLVQDGGWHFSCVGGVESVIDKVKAFSHQEFNKPELLDRERMESFFSYMEDPLGWTGYEPIRLLPSDIWELLPKTILNNQEHYDSLGWLWKDDNENGNK